MQKEKRKQSNDEEDDSSSRKRRKADLSKPVSFISTEPESSRSRPKGGYDVFLSFRGEDTRKTITDHLYHALIQAGIHTFRDDNELPRGEEISPQLLRAIEGSRISVVVFSRNYASSRWCLDELVKIIECRQKIHQVVLPIFYDTDPSDIRKQTGSYAKAFDEHEEHFKGEMEKVNRWREALTQAANLSGYGLNDTNGNEAELIKKVVNDVACKLGNKTLHVAKHPVGISSRVRDVISLLRGARNSVGIVGIYGIAGIGKTTIAKAVFNSFYSEFEGSSFLSGVKEISDKPNGLVELQERLLHDILKPNVWKISNDYEGMNLIKERLHRKNVLVVFDDVDKREQLEALMGERCWFGDGSKIMVVTKNKHLLTEVKVDGMYHAMELYRDQSLQLFSLHAFRETRPAKDYEELSEKVVDYCKGLPLALKILGCHLSTRDKAGWEIDIAHWRNIPHDDIQAKLRVSFDALDVDSSEIFLDIACFFVGQDKDYVADIISARYSYHPEVAFRALIGRSLIEIDTENHNRLWMHDIVRQMGREIIRQRSLNHLEKYSRIVIPKDANDVVSKEMGTKAVEGLALDVQGSFNTKSFTKMRRLKLLQITGAHLAGSYSLLPRELIWLCWLECPLKYLPSDFHLSELVILDMQKSKVRKLWKGTKILNKLKILNLSYSKCLVKTPNFGGLPSLERLILVECTSLVKVHQSIGNLKSLILLNLEGCNSLKTLPESMGSLKSLQTLNVTRCSQLAKLPDSLGGLESLTLLIFEFCDSLKTLPKSMGSLKSLQTLNVTRCSQLEKLPNNLGSLQFLTLLNLEFCDSLKTLPKGMGSLKSLQTLNVTRCSQLEKLPNNLGSLESLTLLNLDLCYSLKTLPESMGSLKSLQTLNITRCSQLVKLPESLDGLESLTGLLIKDTAIKQLPTSARYLKKLTNLSFGGYKNVFCSLDPQSESQFSRFSSWLSPQSCSSSIAMRLDSFTSFTSLKKLDLSDSGLSDAISSIDFGRFSFLKYLDLSGNGFFNLPSGISRLPKIRYFLVERCKNLLSISELPSNLASLSIQGCTSIERVGAALYSKRVLYRMFEGCPNLIEVQAMDLWDNHSSEDKDLWDNNSYKDKDLRHQYTTSFSRICGTTIHLRTRIFQGRRYEISLAGGEIPEWFSHRGEGSSLSFHSPSVPDGNKLRALLVWVVFASTNEATALTPFLQRDICFATLKNKSNGAPLKNKNGVEIFDKKAVLNFGRNSTKLSWINRIHYITLEESLQGVEEVELNVKVRGSSDAPKCWVEKCGVHLIMEKEDEQDKQECWIEKCRKLLIMEKEDEADSDIQKCKKMKIEEDEEEDVVRNKLFRASTLADASTFDDQRMQSILIRELQEGKIIGFKRLPTKFFCHFDKNNS
uniref:TIR domain-containing protein n=1 Tax=Salix viminalis TaxID=40686 RepID=A0A6N2L5G3_SALVM